MIKGRFLNAFDKGL